MISLYANADANCSAIWKGVEAESRPRPTGIPAYLSLSGSQSQTTAHRSSQDSASS